MRSLIRSLAGWVTVGVLVWAVEARDRARARRLPWAEVMARDVRSFVTHRFDPFVLRLGLAGGRVSPWGVLEHVGRTSGAVHRTPVTPRQQGDRVVIPLPYGVDVQWVRNVLAAGRCRLQLHETIYELGAPAVIMPDDVPDLPAVAHEALDMSGSHYLRLDVLDRAPGTFAEPPAEFTTHAALAGLPGLEIVRPS